jgi:molybdopterin-guanine dinucleotide biosynthesis protein A
MTKHKKHTNLERRSNQNFAPMEIAFLGTSCATIADIVARVSQNLSGYRLAYFDASHAKEITGNKVSEFVFHHEGNVQITTVGNINKFQQRLDFAKFDCVFINGNHFQGTKQILVLDPAKEASVLKRLAQLDAIQFVIKATKDSAYFSFLLDKYPDIANIPCYTIDEIDKITVHINALLQKNIPTLKGVVLVGGKSSRMGTDKSELKYFGKPQKEVASTLLEKNKISTFYSVEKASAASNEIPDAFLNLGPFGAICSAFQKDPNAAWFVLATDVPFVTDEIIKLLLQKRNPSKLATAIKGVGKEFVEPLITIYEPKAYPVLLQYLAQGYSCPRKMLINSDVEVVEIADMFIRNINTLQEFELAKKEIDKC